MKFFTTFILFLTLAGCSAIQKDETLTWSVQKLYSEAKADMNKGSYTSSRKNYERILSRYPFGRYAQQTNLDLIRLNYKDKEYDKAVVQADKFLQLYPKHPYADYARYMKGVISYSRDVSIIDKILPTNIAQSDQSLMKKAFEEFDQLVSISPDGEYTEDSKYRMRFLRNVIAEHEIHVAEYYLQRGAYLASANRAKYILENYSKAPSVITALAIMTRSYQELGLDKLSADSKRVLETNFKNQLDDANIEHILTGNIRKKPGLWSSIRRSLSN